MNVYPFIKVERAEKRNVKRACALLEVSRAAFYAWLRLIPSARKRADAELLEKDRDHPRHQQQDLRVPARARSAALRRP
ncbi:MAG: hypothetical protein ACRDJ2_04895 [Actinomycetota bacterium]